MAPARLLRDAAYPKSDAAGLRALGEHLLLLAACAVLAEWSIVGRVLQPVAFIFLFCPSHECVHRTAFRRRALNDAVGFLIGVLLILPPAWFGAFHVAHHKHTQDPARDPEIRWSGFTRADIRKTGPRAWNDRLWALSGAGYWKERVATTLMYACGTVPAADLNFVHTERLARRLVREARLFVAIYALVLAVAAAGGGAPLWRHWGFPALAGQPFLRFYLTAEHTGCELAHEPPPAAARQRADAREALRRGQRLSRTSARHIWPRAATRLLFWNMPYHAEHHAFPEVPFAHLPALSAALHDADAQREEDSERRGCRGEGLLSAYWHDLRAAGKLSSSVPSSGRGL